MEQLASVDEQLQYLPRTHQKARIRHGSRPVVTLETDFVRPSSRGRRRDRRWRFSNEATQAVRAYSNAPKQPGGRKKFHVVANPFRPGTSKRRFLVDRLAQHLRGAGATRFASARSSVQL